VADTVQIQNNHFLQLIKINYTENNNYMALLTGHIMTVSLLISYISVLFTANT